MAHNGASIGGVVFSPLWAAAISVLGFPIAAAAIGVVAILTTWFSPICYFRGRLSRWDCGRTVMLRSQL